MPKVSTSHGLHTAVDCRYCRIVAAEVLSFMIPSQPDHEVVVSLALLHPLMRLITIYHDPSVRLAAVGQVMSGCCWSHKASRAIPSLARSSCL